MGLVERQWGLSSGNHPGNPGGQGFFCLNKNEKMMEKTVRWLFTVSVNSVNTVYIDFHAHCCDLFLCSLNNVQYQYISVSWDVLNL